MSEAAEVYTTTKKCPECGKLFSVLWPHQWAYKRFWPAHPVYWCSWKCLRANDKKEGEKHVGKPRKITKEQENEAVRIAIETGDPREYLRGLGFDNPAQKWYEIKSRIKDQDPGLYAKLPRVCGKKSKPVKAEPTLADAVQGITEAAETFFGECEEMGLKITKAPEAKAPGIAFRVTGIDTVIGNFRYNKRSKYMTWENSSAMVCQKVDKWRQLIRDLPEIMEILGVKE